MDWTALEPGTIFEERYRIESVLGMGGFARVFRATQIGLGRTVAIKVLKPLRGEPDGVIEPARQRADMEDWVQRFRREAKVVSQLSDPHTITMYDYGSTDSGMWYMVFEHISGHSLEEVIDSEGAMEPGRAVEILRQCLSSIEEAHSKGVLHRDLKPANIMLFEHVGRQDQVKVLDFGIAKPIQGNHDFTQVDLTRDGKVIGTPRYMAPEQLKGTAIGPPADIYCLGLVAYEMITGQKAVSGDKVVQVIQQQLAPEPIEIPDSLELPLGLRTAIHCMVAKSQRRRYQSAREVVVALEQWKQEIDLRVDAPTRTLDMREVMGANATLELVDEVKEQPAALRDDTEQQTRPTIDGQQRGRGIATVVAGFIGVIAMAAGVYFVVSQFVLAPETDVQKHSAAIESPGGHDAEVNHTESETTGEITNNADSSQAERMVLMTEPTGADIWVNGSPLGPSPAEFKVDEFTFPLRLKGKLDDARIVETTIEEPRESLKLVFDSGDEEGDAASEQAEVPEPEPTEPSSPPPSRDETEATGESQTADPVVDDRFIPLD